MGYLKLTNSAQSIVLQELGKMLQITNVQNAIFGTANNVSMTKSAIFAELDTRSTSINNAVIKKIAKNAKKEVTLQLVSNVMMDITCTQNQDLTN